MGKVVRRVAHTFPELYSVPHDSRGCPVLPPKRAFVFFASEEGRESMICPSTFFEQSRSIRLRSCSPTLTGPFSPKIDGDRRRSTGRDGTFPKLPLQRIKQKIA